MGQFLAEQLAQASLSPPPSLPPPHPPSLPPSLPSCILFLPNHLLHHWPTSFHARQQQHVQHVQTQEREKNVIELHPEGGGGEAVAAEHYVKENKDGNAVGEDNEEQHLRGREESR